MAEISIGLGIFFKSHTIRDIGVTAGGIIVPGYIALYLHSPAQVIITFTVAILVWLIIREWGN